MKREWLLSLCSKLKQTDRFRGEFRAPQAYESPRRTNLRSGGIGYGDLRFSGHVVVLV